VTWGTWGLGEPLTDHSQLGNGVPILDGFAPIKNYDEIVLQLGSNVAVVNGTPQTLEVVPFTQNNRTFVPLRFIAEALGCDVEWVGKTKNIIIRKEKA
ncbi:MAG: copper amine oxidase N-terminal domain-containing protein, partial [Bacillota bacterium]|nr:copper amine oxidase N-terminal domain-containing protein [Bacillota bacterium]